MAPSLFLGSLLVTTFHMKHDHFAKTGSGETEGNLRKARFRQAASTTRCRTLCLRESFVTYTETIQRTQINTTRRVRWSRYYYHTRNTGDAAFLAEIWPVLNRAMEYVLRSHDQTPSCQPGSPGCGMDMAAVRLLTSYFPFQFSNRICL
jgi:hypothetical protein